MGQPFANGPYAKGLMGQATITDAGLSALRIGFEVGWSDIEATLPTDIDFNNCPAPSCKTAENCKKKSRWCVFNCEKVCSWTGDPSVKVALKAGADVAKSMGLSWLTGGLLRQRSLLFGPTPLDTQMSLSDTDPTYSSFVGGVRVGDSTVFAGDMTGYLRGEGLGAARGGAGGVAGGAL